MSRLRVLHAIGGGDTGGAMSHLLPMASALERAGCEVGLVCLGDGGLVDEARARGLAVSVLPMGGARDPRVLRPLRRLLAASPRWDVLHSHGMRANLPSRLVTRGMAARPCLFATVHSDLRLDYASPALARMFEVSDRATARWVDAIFCVSGALRDLLIERGYPAGRLFTVRSGLEARLGVAGDRPGTADGRPRIGVVARLVPVKDLPLALEVADRLRRTHPQVELLIVGDGPERAQLEAVVARSGLEETVRFTGRLSEMAPVLATLDACLVTSLFEGGVSMSVLEAMAAGIPVVTTDAGGVAEAVVDGETGFVVSRQQERGALAASLAERAAALLDDSALRARMGRAGAVRVAQHFDVDRAAAQVLRIYERCLAARGKKL